MTAPLWQAGHLYLPGDIVQPITAPATTPVAIPNPGFETGDDTGWDLGTATAVSTADKFTGTYSIAFSGTGGLTDTLQDTASAVQVGQSITARCMYQQGAASAGHNGGRVMLAFYTSGMVLIGTPSLGNVVDSGSGGAWGQSTVTAVAPDTAAFVKLGVRVNRTNSNPSWADDFAWNHVAQAPAGLVFKAVQANAGISGTSEPAWPNTVGLTVVDNEVTWEAIAATRVEWTAAPILVSGASEPTWPTQIGEFVADGSIKWEAFSRRVEDENCPNTKVVAIVGSKVFAADRDIARFCATANPLDWTTERDAGYLPLGLQQANANDFDTGVFNQYRSNFVAFNASSFQNWQADPDPAAMALLDQMDGVGSTWQQAAQPVANDLFYLAALGVRTVGIAGGSTNLQAGDVGMPIDPLVKDAVRVAIANSSAVRSTYYPSSGQYWLAFAEYPPPLPSISGAVPDGFVDDSGSGAYTVSGGVLPIGPITVLSGTVPPGFTLHPDGSYTYAYTTAGDYTWTVGGVDADGTPFSTPDSATVRAGVWWVTNYGTIALDNDLYISANPISFGAATTRTPNITPGYGPKGVAVDVVLVANNSGTGNIERITDMTAPVTTTLQGPFPAVRHIRVIDGVVFQIPLAGTTYLYSTDDGATWLSGTVPGSPDMADIARLDNGRWLTLVSGLAGGFYYSDEDLPTVAGDWTFAGASDPGGAGHAGGYIAVSGNTAVSFGTTNVKRTTDGATWGAVTGPGDVDRRDGLSINGVFICQTAQNGGIRRSIDAGATWSTVVFTTAGEVVQRLEAGGDTVVAVTHSGQMWVSTDDGATWTQSTTPGANGKRAAYVLSTA